MQDNAERFTRAVQSQDKRLGNTKRDILIRKKICKGIFPKTNDSWYVVSRLFPSKVSYQPLGIGYPIPTEPCSPTTRQPPPPQLLWVKHAECAMSSALFVAVANSVPGPILLRSLSHRTNYPSTQHQANMIKKRTTAAHELLLTESCASFKQDVTGHPPSGRSFDLLTLKQKLT